MTYSGITQYYAKQDLTSVQKEFEANGYDHVVPGNLTHFHQTPLNQHLIVQHHPQLNNDR